MRLVVIPPYLNPAVNWGFVLENLVADYRKKGGLKGVEVIVDEGYLIDSPSEKRDEAFLANINIGIINKIKEYSEGGKVDAIVLTGALDPGFIAGRLMSSVPIAAAVHSGFHVASLIGDRFSEIHAVAPSSLIVRHLGERYGFSHKLVSVRWFGHSSTETYMFLRKYKGNWDKRFEDPGLKKITEDLAEACIAAIEKDRADSVIFGCEHIQSLADGARKLLDKAGYSEIPIVCELPAGLEMAQAMVNMKLRQTARAYPGADLKAIPEYW
ncbi:MAG: aspartate/glutamate racemase family protein [Chloroflexota bacterium]